MAKAATTVKCSNCEINQPVQCRRCAAPLRVPIAEPPTVRVAQVTLLQAERALIEGVLARHPPGVAASLLGIGYRALYRKIAKHGIKLAKMAS